MTPQKDFHRKGFTLVETIIAIGLFGVLITIAVGAFVNALHTQRQVGDLISAQSNTSLAIEQMARDIRTGYLFCHDAGSETSNGACNNGTGAASQCVENGAIWTCPALSYYDVEGNNVRYSFVNGTLMRSDSSEQNGAAEPLTGDDVTVQYLSFVLRGQLEGDHEPPLITISLGISASSTDPAVSGDVLHFQTSVSARQIDCDPTTNTC